MMMKFKKPTIIIYFDIEKGVYITNYEFNRKYRGTSQEYRFIKLVKEI